MAQLINLVTPTYTGTMTAKLVTSADVVHDTADSVTRATNGTWYSCSFTGATNGEYTCVLYENGTVVASLPVYIESANGTWGDTHSEFLKMPRSSAMIPSGQFTMTTAQDEVQITYQIEPAPTTGVGYYIIGSTFVIG